MKHHRHCRSWSDENPCDHRAALKDLFAYITVCAAVMLFVAVIVSQLSR
jgi:hypothetical protein